jgi:hypothetical protein
MPVVTALRLATTPDVQDQDDVRSDLEWAAGRWLEATPQAPGESVAARVRRVAAEVQACVASFFAEAAQLAQAAAPSDEGERLFEEIWRRFPAAAGANRHAARRRALDEWLAVHPDDRADAARRIRHYSLEAWPRYSSENPGAYPLSFQRVVAEWNAWPLRPLGPEPTLVVETT